MKKELLIPILILGLTLAFAVVSLLVFLNGGRSAKLISRKMRLGALLLTFNAMVWGAKGQDYDGPITACYVGYNDPVFFGIDANMNSNTGTGLALTNFSKESIADENATGLGYSAGVFYWLPIGEITDSRHSLTFKLQYSSSVMSLEKPLFYTLNYIEPFMDISGKPYKVKGIVEHSFETLDLKIMYNYRVFPNISISVGPAISYVMKSNLKEKAGIDEKLLNEVRFRDDLKPVKYDNNHTAVLSDGKPLGSKDFLLGIYSEISYEMITGTGLDLLPYIGISKTVTNIVAENRWKIYSFYAGLSFRYRILI